MQNNDAYVKITKEHEFTPQFDIRFVRPKN